MPPGKRSDTRAAKAAEINELKSRFVTVSRKYKDQMKHREWLSLNTANKLEKFSTLENTLMITTQEHEEEVNQMEQGRMTRTNKMEQDLHALLERKAYLEQELASFELAEHEDHRLRALVLELEEQVVEEESCLLEDTGWLRAKAFRDRRVVDNTTRRTLAAMQDSIQKASVDKIRYESEHALKTRRQLEAQLVLRSAEADEMLRKQREKSTELSKMRVFRQVLDETTSLQEKRIMSLEKTRQGASQQVAKLQDDLDRTFVMLNQAKEQKAEQSRLSQTLKSVRNEWRDAELASLHYRAVTLKSIRSMLYTVRNRMFEERLRAKQKAYQSSSSSSPTGTAARARPWSHNKRGSCGGAALMATPRDLLEQIKNHYTDLPHRRAQSAPIAISRLTAGLDVISSEKAENSCTSSLPSCSGSGGGTSSISRKPRHQSASNRSRSNPPSGLKRLGEVGTDPGGSPPPPQGFNPTPMPRGGRASRIRSEWSHEDLVRIWHSDYYVAMDQGMVVF